MMRRRLAYLGTPQMAVTPLRALVDAGHDVALVVTGADKRRGRGGEPSPSPVKAAALELGLQVSHAVDDVLTAGVELGVVVAFGRIIKPHVLAQVPMVNVHFSLLPRWRGAAPVERALLAGDTETGTCLMAVEEGLDTGAVYDTVRLPIGPRATADELRRDLVAAGSEQLLRCLGGPLPDAVPQVGEPLYAAKIRPEELRLDWGRPAAELDRLVRVGGAWTSFRGRRVKVLAANIEGGRLVPTRVQPEGKGPMDAADFFRGLRPHPGERFT